MKDKDGFTLVELLAVIAILAILVIIALPNVMGMFNDAKKSSFTTELKQIYKVAQQTYINDSMFDQGEQVYARCNSGKCEKELDLSGRTQLEYYIKIDKGGKVSEFYATDGTYQYSYSDGDLLVENIGGVKQVSEIEDDEIIKIVDCNVNKSGGNSGSGDNNIICKRATALHTEVCTNGVDYSHGAWTGGCKRIGYTSSGSKGTDIITYGNLGTSGTLNPGDAFDCDVNNDGVYNATNERFYYLKSEGDYASLIYYNNVSNGSPNNTAVYKYSNGDGTGPDVAYEQLPNTSMWSNPLLRNNYERQIKNRYGETTYVIQHGPRYNLPLFTYTSKAARLVTIFEITSACGNGIAFKNGPASNEGYFNKCIYILENTNFSTATYSEGYWTENWAGEYSAQSNQYTGVHTVLGGIRSFGSRSSTNQIGVRPVIEVSVDSIDK